MRPLDHARDRPEPVEGRLKVVACDVLRREVYWCAARSRETVEVVLLPQGLHDNSDLCRERLQPLVNEADPEQCDAVVLGYGLCNNALNGLRAGRVRVVIPRAHDCITLLLGSKERYAELFAARPGTYWFSSGWVECKDGQGDRAPPMAKSGLGPRRLAADFDELVARYGRENAEYLAAFMGAWERHYTHGCLVEFAFAEGLGLPEKIERLCRQKGWEFVRVQGDLSLIQDGLDGRWDPDRFLVLEPGQRVRAEYDEGIIAAEPPAVLPRPSAETRATP